jgi:hypothetical protein
VTGDREDFRGLSGIFRNLSNAVEQADAHPESELLQRRADQLTDTWTARLAEHAGTDLTASERLRIETDTAAAVANDVARRAGRRALEEGNPAEAAAHWRVAAVFENWEDAEFLASLGEEPVMLRLIELYLQMNQPNLAVAWCTIATAEGWPADQVHPLLHRAWHMLSSENG